MTVQKENDMGEPGVVEPRTAVEEAAWRLVAALEHKRDAINGDVHPGDHDTVLHFDPCTNLPGVEHVRDIVGDCAQCGGAQYGADDLEQAAHGDLRVALGLSRRPWESEYPAEAFAAAIANLRSDGETR